MDWRNQRLPARFAPVDSAVAEVDSSRGAERKIGPQLPIGISSYD